jgi:hypothetical protein
MPNLADIEAHGHWLAERPEPEVPDLDTLDVFTPEASEGLCTCGPDPRTDKHHTCKIHPPF